MKIKFLTATFVVLLMGSCNFTNHDKRIVVREYLNAELSNKVNFVTSEFQLEFEGEREFPKGESSIKMMDEHFKNFELAEASYSDLKIESLTDNSVEVTYSVESWLNECFGSNSKHVDTYVFKDNKIDRITQSVTGGLQSSEFEINLQKNFHTWIEKQNLTDSIAESANFLKYLKLYCDSISEFKDDI